MKSTEDTHTDEQTPHPPGNHVEQFVRRTRHSLGLDSSFMEHNYTRVTSGMRITAEILTVLSGWKHATHARSAAAGIGIVSNLLGIVFKQQPQLKEELDAISEMSTGEYVALRLKQALEPQKHIRQTLAASMMASAVLFMIAAVRSGRKGEGLGAAVGFIAACVLSFTKDDRKAWERQSIIASTLASPVAIGYGFEAGLKKGDPYIPGAVALHTASNALTFLETYAHKKDKGAQDSEDKGNSR